MKRREIIFAINQYDLFTAYIERQDDLSPDERANILAEAFDELPREVREEIERREPCLTHA